MSQNRSIPSLRELTFGQVAKQGLFSEAFPFGAAQVVQSLLDEKLVPQLLQAVIDDDRDTVVSLLKANPELLLIEPPADLVIESQYTWQRFIAENPVAMAAKRHQIEMLKIMVPVLNQMIDENPELKPQTEAVIEAIEANWNLYQAQDESKELHIPKDYTSRIDELIAAFIKDQTASHEGVSEATEATLLEKLYSKVLPENPVALNEYYDIGLLLYTAYNLYTERFDDFQNWGQRDAFCIRVMGGLQKVLPPEDAKVFCEGLYHVVEEEEGLKISERAASLKLDGGENFYPSSRADSTGVGFKYLCEAGEGAAGRSGTLGFCAISKYHIKRKQRACFAYATNPAEKSLSLHRELR